MITSWYPIHDKVGTEFDGEIFRASGTVLRSGRCKAPQFNWGRPQSPYTHWAHVQLDNGRIINVNLYATLAVSSVHDFVFEVRAERVKMRANGRTNTLPARIQSVRIATEEDSHLDTLHVIDELCGDAKQYDAAYLARYNAEVVAKMEEIDAEVDAGNIEWDVGQRRKSRIARKWNESNPY